MSRGARIAKHSGILMGMELGLRLLDAFVAVILARYLAPQGFGLMAFAISYANLFSILPGFGMGAMSTRDIARDPSQLSRYVSNGLVVKALLAVATMLLVWGITALLRYAPEKQAVVLLATVLMICDTNLRYTLSFFQGMQRMKTVALTNLAVRAGWVVGSLAIVGLHGGVQQLIGVRVLIAGTGMLLTIGLISKRLGQVRWHFEPGFMWHLMKASFPFALFRLFGGVYTDIDTVMLSAMRGDVMTGWYAAAFKVLRIFGFVQGGFFGALLPAMSRFSKESTADLIKTIGRGCRYLAMISMPIAGVVCMLSDEFTRLLYGPRYEGTAVVLRIIIWSLMFSFLNSSMVAAIAAVNKEKQASTYLIAGCLISGLSNLVAIPLWGHLGAAGTTVLTEAAVFGLQVRLLRRTLPTLDIAGELVGPAAVTGIMMVVTWLLRPLGLWIAVPVAAVVYVAGLVLFRLVGEPEWRLARQLVPFLRPAGSQA